MEEGIINPPAVTEEERKEDSTSMQVKCERCGEPTNKRNKIKKKANKSETAHIAALLHHMTSTLARASTKQDIQEHLKLNEEENTEDWRNHGEQKLCANYVVDTNEDKPATLKKLLAAANADDSYNDLIRAIQLKKRYTDLKNSPFLENAKTASVPAESPQNERFKIFSKICE